MSKVVTRAQRQVRLFTPCAIALSGYSQSIVFARGLGGLMLGYAMAAKLHTRDELTRTRRQFLINRNKPTKARFRVNARCAP